MNIWIPVTIPTCISRPRICRGDGLKPVETCWRASMELTDDLLCLFNAQVRQQGGAYVIEVPEQEIAVGDVETGGVYRVAMFPRARQTAATAESEPAAGRERAGPEPPVEKGDVLDVEIEDIGEQGDGIARVGPGYVVIVPDTERGERVAVRITEVRENMAFAEVVERHDRMG